MIVNAKHYNDKRSAVYEDAERLRKTASNFFTRHNPAYRDPTYVATPTPVPGESTETPGTQPARLSEMSIGSPIKKSEPVEEVLQAPEETGEVEENDESEEDFKGKTFQQAQDQMLEELIHYIDEEYVLRHYHDDNISTDKIQKWAGNLYAIPQSAPSVSRRLLSSD